MTDAPNPAAVPPPAPRRRLRRMALAVAGALAGLGAGGAWLVGSESGLQATLALARGLSGGALLAEGARGRLWDELSIARLAIDTGPAGPRIVVTDAGLRWNPAALVHGRLDIARLAAAQVEVATRPSDEPLTPPTDLRLPLAAHIGELRIEQLVLRSLEAPANATNATSPKTPAPPATSATADPVADAEPGAPGPETLRLSALAARLDSDGRHHRLIGLAATWEMVRLSGEATLDGGALDSPDALRLQARATGSADGRAFQVDAQAVGPLAALNVTARAQASPAGEGQSAGATPPAPTTANNPQSAQAAPPSTTAGRTTRPGKGSAPPPLHGTLTATLAPFAPWPVPAAQAQVSGLDPAAWAAAAPQASLDLDLRIHQEHGAPRATLTARNARPGPLDQGRLPLAGLTLEVRPAASAPAQPVPGDAPGQTERPSAPPSTPTRHTQPGAAPALPPLQLALMATLAADGRNAAGRLQGQGSLRDGRLAATLALAGVDAHALHRQVQPSAIDGTLTLSADTTRQRLQAALENRIAPRMRLAADLTREGPRLTLHQARLSEAGPGGTSATGAILEASGHLALGNTTAFQLDGTARNLDLARFIKAPPTRLSATLKASGQLGSGPGLPRLDLAYRLTDSRINGQPASGDGRLAIAGQRLADADLRLAVGDNTLQATGRFGAPADRLRFTLAAPRLDPVAGAFGLSGSLDAQGELAGTLADPGGRIALATPRLGLPGGLTVSGLDARLALGSGADGEASARVLLKRLGQGGGRDPAAGALVRDADLQVAGSKRRQDWTFHSTLPGDQGLARTLALSLSGGLVAPDKQAPAGPRWIGRLTALDLGGDLPVRLSAPASLDLAPTRIAIADARFQGGAPSAASNARNPTTAGSAAGVPWRLLLNRLEWQAAAPTQGRAAPALRLSSSGELHDLPARLLLPTAARASTLTLGGRWSLDLGESANGQLELGREQGDLLLGEGGGTPQPLGLSALALRGRLDQGRLSLALDGRGARLGNLTGQLTAQLLRAAPVTNNPGTSDAPPTLLGWTLARQAPLAGEARLDVPDLAWLGPLAYPGLATGGTLAARVQLAGNAAAPQLNGEARGEKLAVRLADLGLNLGNGTLDTRLADGHLRLARLHFDSLPGETPRDVRLKELFDTRPGAVDVSGDLDLKAGTSSLDWSLERFTPLQRRNRWLMASGRGQVRIAEQKLEVGGEIKADGAFLGLPDLGAPSLPDDVVIKGQAAPPEARLRITRLDLGLNLGPRFFFKGAGLESRLAGELRLTTRDDGTLRANGTIRTADGIFDAYGTRLAIERGIVSFQGPPARPSLNIRALRRGLPVEAGVDVTGTVDRPVVKLVSVPEVPEAEKLSWMVLGKGPGEAGGADPSLLLSAASALFGSEDSTTKRLQETFGIDEISFRSGALDGSGGPTATSRVAGGQGFSGGAASASGNQVLTVGKRISANATLAYEQSVSTVAAQAGSVIRLTVDLTRRLSVVARAGTDNALDLLYTFSFGRSSKAQARQDARAAREAGADQDNLSTPANPGNGRGASTKPASTPSAP
ncbi:translocation and assembly module TamB [Oryzomicrobium terrae]|uniref:Translocation and assembly module TamB n=1 Tax=Oryzomicrobium terrae TaxID=1735038 RepID=A0A5C1EAR8_9RHOO|nr:translocation/assembly module TamB domain-containing protein [Oryzomicrobium terrae]QEL65257.1 translocation and assembly module TamB [Oryzomicrobium terrae]